jgi:hypothetical protein
MAQWLRIQDVASRSIFESAPDRISIRSRANRFSGTTLMFDSERGSRQPDNNSSGTDHCPRGPGTDAAVARSGADVHRAKLSGASVSHRLQGLSRLNEHHHFHASKQNANAMDSVPVFTFARSGRSESRAYCADCNTGARRRTKASGSDSGPRRISAER